MAPSKKKDVNTLAELKTLGRKLLSSREHINNLPILLTFINPSSRPQYALEALLSLQAFFTPLIPDLPSTTSAADPRDEPEIIYRIWLRSKFEDLVQSLIDIAISSQCEQALRVSTINLLLIFHVSQFLTLFCLLSRHHWEKHGITKAYPPIGRSKIIN